MSESYSGNEDMVKTVMCTNRGLYTHALRESQR